MMKIKHSATQFRSLSLIALFATTQLLVGCGTPDEASVGDVAESDPGPVVQEAHGLVLSESEVDVLRGRQSVLFNAWESVLEAGMISEPSLNLAVTKRGVVGDVKSAGLVESLSNWESVMEPVWANTVGFAWEGWIFRDT